MFNPSTYQNSRTGGAAFMEAVQQHDRGRERRPVTALDPVFMPLRGTQLTGRISGPVARLQITHRFDNPVQADGPVLEAVYRFPLPGDAAVTNVEVTFGETRIRTELADRTEAEHEYDRARATGHQAVLLTRESPDVFSMHISGIEPGQEVIVVTDFVKSLTPDRAGFSLRIPLTPAPRYVSDAAQGGRHAHGQPLAVAHDPGHRFSFDLLISGARSVSSPTHRISTSTVKEGIAVTLSDGSVSPDRDLVIDVAPPREAHRPALQVFHHPADEDFDYFLALVNPPEQNENTQNKPREVILLVDRSGSMHGAKWEAADWAVRRFLTGLCPEDQFSIGLFHHETRWFSRVTVPATAENIAAAREFIDAYDDSGGTVLERALEEAITCGRATGDYSRHIVIISDAQVSNARDNLALARAEAERSPRRRINMLCIDAAPNSWLVHELVAIGGGHAQFLTSDPDEDDISTALDEVMSFWDQPIETGMKLSVNRPDVWVMGRQVQDKDKPGASVGQIDLGDLPAARPVWVVGRCRKTDAPLSFSLESASGSIAADSGDIVQADHAISALFGARRLAVLEYQLQPSQWDGRWRRSSENSDVNVRRQLVTESLHYGLICSETSFVAVREEAGKLVQRGAIVPNAFPAGWQEPLAFHSMNESGAQTLGRQAPFESQDVAEMSSRFSWSPPPMHSERSAPGSRRHIEQPFTKIYKGIPDVSSGEAVLSEYQPAGSGWRLTKLRVSIHPSSAGSTFDAELLLYAGSHGVPRARARIKDILQQGGIRPLNIRVSRHHTFRIILRDVHDDQVPELTVEIAWEPIG